MVKGLPCFERRHAKSFAKDRFALMNDEQGPTRDKLLVDSSLKGGTNTVALCVTESMPQPRLFGLGILDW